MEDESDPQRFRKKGSARVQGDRVCEENSELWVKIIDVLIWEHNGNDSADKK